MSSKTSSVALHLDICRLISIKTGVMIDTIKLCILIPAWMTFTFIQGHSCMRSSVLLCSFSWNVLYQIGFSILTQLVGVLKFMLNLFCTIDVYGTRLHLHDFIAYTLTQTCVRTLVN